MPIEGSAFAEVRDFYENSDPSLNADPDPAARASDPSNPWRLFDSDVSEYCRTPADCANDPSKCLESTKWSYEWTAAVPGTWWQRRVTVLIEMPAGNPLTQYVPLASRDSTNAVTQWAVNRVDSEDGGYYEGQLVHPTYGYDDGDGYDPRYYYGVWVGEAGGPYYVRPTYHPCTYYNEYQEFEINDRNPPPAPPAGRRLDAVT